MGVSESIRKNMERSSWIRKMFEEGIRLKKQFGADKVFDFSLGNPDIEPPEEFTKTLVSILSTKEKGIHGYMPNAGYPFVREAIAKKVGREHQFKIGPESVIMTVGAAGGINVILKTILDPGDEVLVVRPYFAEYFFYVENHRGKLVVVDSAPDFSLSVEAVAKALTPKTACIILNSPNNPTGRIYGRKEIVDLSDLLKEHGKKTGRTPYVICDEPYRDIVYGGLRVPPVLDVIDECFVVSSYSKSLSIPGERIGYIAVSPKCDGMKELVDGMVMCNRILGFVNAPAIMQRVVAELIDTTADIEIYEKRRNTLSKGLSDAGIRFAKPEGAFYFFCEAPGGDDVAFVMHLKEYNILGVPGQGFGYPGWFRLSYAVPDETIAASIPVFAEAMRMWAAKSR